MIGFVTVGTNDLPRAAEFYDRLFEAIHGQRIYSSERGALWSLSRISPGFGVFRPNDGQPASYCNGTMVALAMVSREAVDALYNRALSLGAVEVLEQQDLPHFYINYFRDLDGNKLGVYYMNERRLHWRL